AEAFATRSGILDAAELLFQTQGVSGTSLQDIAAAAGVTRGAVYWHFKDKGDVFNAMMARVCLPMEEAAAGLAASEASPPLDRLRTHLRGILERVAADEQVRRVFQIATQKVEYVDEMAAVRERHLQMRRDHLAVLQQLLRAAQQRGDIVQAPPARQLAIGLHALVDGLIQNWMLDPASFPLRTVGSRAVETHLAGLSAPPPPAIPGSGRTPPRARVR
ncbi:MAG TPA: TetR family transcriptional regulator, partial [Rubrivivax sp.]|nr:TetR family transcriptional regulator [Rubrivivax sp.]